MHALALNISAHACAISSDTNFHHAFTFFKCISYGHAWLVIRLQRIYNLWSIHAILLSVLHDYGLYYTLLYYFWDYRINRRPSPYCCFIACFTISRKRNIKRTPNGMKPSAAWFFGRIWSGRLGVHVRRSSRRPRDRRAPPYWVHPLSRGPLEAPPTDFFHLYKPTYPKNIDNQDRSGVPPPQASVAVTPRTHPPVVVTPNGI